MTVPLPLPTRRVTLPAGTLTLYVEQADLPLDQLCGYASRRSRKRGFVFVSKVLGKHYPARPCVMARVHALLAEKLGNVAGPVVLVALAETATGLGHGLFEQFLERTGRSDVLFLHTTRYRLARPLALAFEEGHSHAPEHLLYEPADPADVQLFRAAATLILVDDEMSTGRTLANLAAAYRRANPRLASVRLVSITDWLGIQRRAALAREIGVATGFHSLLRGRFTFAGCGDFDPGEVPDVVGRGDGKDACLPMNYGRLGLRRPLAIDGAALSRAAGVRPGERLLVLGTGEFAHAPFRLGRWLEEQGWDVHFQATTRSPLLVGGDLASGLEFLDNYHDEMPNYLYNVADRCYDRIVLAYETRPLPSSHRLPEILGAHLVSFV